MYCILRLGGMSIQRNTSSGLVGPFMDFRSNGVVSFDVRQFRLATIAEVSLEAEFLSRVGSSSLFVQTDDPNGRAAIRLSSGVNAFELIAQGKSFTMRHFNRETLGRSNFFTFIEHSSSDRTLEMSATDFRITNFPGQALSVLLDSRFASSQLVIRSLRASDASRIVFDSTLSLSHSIEATVNHFRILRQTVPLFSWSSSELIFRSSLFTVRLLVFFLNHVFYFQSFREDGLLH